MAEFTRLSLRRFLKNILPISIKNKIRAILGTKTLYKSSFYPIQYSLGDKTLNFYYCAPPNYGIKAQKDGIENTIVRRVFSFCHEKPDGLIVDVGMNFGFLSMAWSKAMSNHQIVSFEVHPGIIKNVKDAMVKSEISNMEIVGSPVSNQAGISVDFSAGIYTASATDKNYEKFSLKTITLDEHFQNRSLNILAIKIDTDKFDFEVLQGTQKIIQKDRPFIAIEVNQDPRIVPFLLDFGYYLYDMKGEEVVSDQIDLNDARYLNIFAYPEKQQN